MDLLDAEQAAREAVFKYFGYVEGWLVLPLDDETGSVWMLPDGDEGVVIFADSMEQLENEGDGVYYENQIYTQRHLPKWVYRGAEFTMIVVDTHNQLLQIFDNSKEIK